MDVDKVLLYLELSYSCWIAFTVTINIRASGFSISLFSCRLEMKLTIVRGRLFFGISAVDAKRRVEVEYVESDNVIARIVDRIRLERVYVRDAVQVGE